MAYTSNATTVAGQESSSDAGFDAISRFRTSRCLCLSYCSRSLQLDNSACAGYYHSKRPPSVSRTPSLEFLFLASGSTGMRLRAGSFVVPMHTEVPFEHAHLTRRPIVTRRRPTILRVLGCLYLKLPKIDPRTRGYRACRDSSLYVNWAAIGGRLDLWVIANTQAARPPGLHTDLQDLTFITDLLNDVNNHSPHLCLH